MYNCYNIAFNYLCKKYGSYTTNFGGKNITYYNKGKNVKQKDGSILKIMDDDDIEIELLLKQYSLSIIVHKELYYKLINLGIIKTIERC